MTWERFGYICRKAVVDSNENESISESLRRIEHEQACSLYGAKIKLNSWPRVILDRIGSMQEKDDAKRALEIYGLLNLNDNFEEPIQFKRVLAYLCWITVIFYLVVLIYQLKVAPAFIETFENLDMSIPRHLVYFQGYWWCFVVVVNVFLVSAFLVGLEMRNVFKFKLGVEDGFFIKYLVFSGVRKSYLKIVGILQYPFCDEPKSIAKLNDEIIEHLKGVDSLGMSVAMEMKELVAIEMKVLLLESEKQLKIISAVIAIVVIAAVFFFMVGAYSPIFVLGDAV